MNKEPKYPIGQTKQKWASTERQLWLDRQTVKRSYKKHVLDKLEPLAGSFDIEQYGALDYEPERYPLFAVKNRDWGKNKLTALVTGGVHGYETSGVHGALRFVETCAQNYGERFNLLIVPCVSPWAYETINRWNPYAVDPNRSFVANSPAAESAALMAYVKSLKHKISVHLDLHETTDTDNTEFRPALAARDNVHHPFWEIPDGFYLVGDTENPCPDFQAHIIEAVGEITHIAPADAEGKIIGEPSTQRGVINYATKALGLCTGFSNANFNTTTEVYPDSSKVDDENCILAQVAAVCSGLDFVAQNA